MRTCTHPALSWEPDTVPVRIGADGAVLATCPDCGDHLDIVDAEHEVFVLRRRLAMRGERATRAGVVTLGGWNAVRMR